MTVLRFERGDTIQSEKSEAMRAAFVQEGVAFTNRGQRIGVSAIRRD